MELIYFFAALGLIAMGLGLFARTEAGKRFFEDEPGLENA